MDKSSNTGDYGKKIPKNFLLLQKEWLTRGICNNQPYFSPSAWFKSNLLEYPSRIIPNKNSRRQVVQEPKANNIDKRYQPHLRNFLPENFIRLLPTTANFNPPPPNSRRPPNNNSRQIQQCLSSEELDESSDDSFDEDLYNSIINGSCPMPSINMARNIETPTPAFGRPVGMIPPHSRDNPERYPSIIREASPRQPPQVRGFYHGPPSQPVVVCRPRQPNTGRQIGVAQPIVRQSFDRVPGQAMTSGNYDEMLGRRDGGGFGRLVGYPGQATACRPTWQVPDRPVVRIPPMTQQSSSSQNCVGGSGGGMNLSRVLLGHNSPNRSRPCQSQTTQCPINRTNDISDTFYSLDNPQNTTTYSDTYHTATSCSLGRSDTENVCCRLQANQKFERNASSDRNVCCKAANNLGSCDSPSQTQGDTFINCSPSNCPFICGSDNSKRKSQNKCKTGTKSGYAKTTQTLVVKPCSCNSTSNKGQPQNSTPCSSSAEHQGSPFNETYNDFKPQFDSSGYADANGGMFFGNDSNNARNHTYDFSPTDSNDEYEQDEARDRFCSTKNIQCFTTY